MEGRPLRIDQQILIELTQRVSKPAALQIHRGERRVHLQGRLWSGASQLRAKTRFGFTKRGVFMCEGVGEGVD